MSNGLSALIIVLLALLIVVGGAMFLLLGEVNPKTPVIENTDNLRQIAVTSLASSINHYGDQQLAELIGSDWVHLGNAGVNCSLITTHCQLADQPCLDLSTVLGQNFNLPVDREAEEGMSGYVVRAISPDMIEIKACYTQADQPIVQRVKVKLAVASESSAAIDGSSEMSRN